MSADAPRPRKSANLSAEPRRKQPQFEVHHAPLPAKPNLMTKRDLFEDLDEPRPRSTGTVAPTRQVVPPVRPPEPLQRVPSRLPLGAPEEARFGEAISPERNSLPRRARDLQQASTLLHDIAPSRVAYAREPGYEGAGTFLLGRPWLLVMIVLSSALIFWFASASPKTIISSFSGGLSGATTSSLSNAFKARQVATAAGEHSMLGAPSISAQFIDQVLAHYGSPAQGTGAIWVEMGQRYGIDPAYALAFFVHESSAGTNPGWAGIKPGGSTTHNVGNIICAGYATCYGRFRDYASWDAGIEDWYKLIANEYVNDRGVATVEGVIPIYAPSFENDVGTYVNTVVDLADTWRQGVVR